MTAVAEMRAAGGGARIFCADKPAYSCIPPEVRALAAERGWETFVLTGFSTHACVLKTALDIFEAGWRPVLMEDLCASHNGLELHTSALIILGKLIGADNIVASEAVRPASMSSIVRRARI